MSIFLHIVRCFIRNISLVYKKILNTIFQWTADQACEHILGLYDRKGFCVVDYLYFANISGKQLFSSHALTSPVEKLREALLADYKTIDIDGIYRLYQNAILDADLVLMDGIAFQIFYFLAKKKWLPNLNGTDFCPYFLSYIKRHFPDRAIAVVLYGTYPHLLEKTKVFLLQQGYDVVYAQDGYTNLDRNNVDMSLKWRPNAIRVLLNARSTPDYPIQEIRTLANKQNIEQRGFIVMNQWGTFDFRVGEQKRAPKLVRTIKLERLWRLFVTPKRQIKKTLQSLAILPYIFSYLLLKKH